MSERAMVMMFFYGVFKRGDVPLLGCSEDPIRYVGRQHLDGWTLHSNGGVAHAHPSDRETAFIEGDVYELPMDVVEHFFDHVEGHPTWYQRIGVMTREGTRCMIYMGHAATVSQPDIGPRWTSAWARGSRVEQARGWRQVGA